MNISQILKGCTPGQLQAVGYMQVIPLISELTDEGFASPTEAFIKSTSYGTLHVENPKTYPMIVPFGAGYITKQAAQDHAVPHAKIVRAKTEERIDTAACIQQSQGGMIGKDKHEMILIPWSLREVALNTRKEQKYDKLWPAITSFNKSLDIEKTGGHLEYFIKQFERELDQFVAEFEIVPNQVGAIIMINGDVVGVERAPSYQYWQAIWKPLIRECYGSLAIQFAKTDESIWKLPIMAKDTMDELMEELIRVQKQETEIVKGTLRDFIKEDFSVEDDEEMVNMKTSTISNQQFKGQIIQKGVKVVYASLFTTEDWWRNKDWHSAKDFKI